jgi:hypothetical protein
MANNLPVTQDFVSVMHTYLKINSTCMTSGLPHFTRFFPANYIPQEDILIAALTPHPTSDAQNIINWVRSIPPLINERHHVTCYTIVV